MKKLILSVAFLGLGVWGFAQQAISADNQQKKETKRADFQQKRDAKNANSANFQQKNDERRLQKMKTDLNLTDAQVNQIKDLNTKKGAQRKDNDAEIQKILTPDQYKKFQELKTKKVSEQKTNHNKRKQESTTK